jgi:S1-C subfamily serine protease
MIRRSFPSLPLAAVLAALGIGVGGGAAAYAVLSDDGTQTVVRQVTVAGSEPAASSPLSVNAIYKRSYKGVVELTVTSEAQLPSLEGGAPRGQGSGFVFDTKGHVITNQHVVENAESISVRFWNGATYGAKVVGSDPSTDLAVIKVDAPARLLEPLTLGDSSQLEVGDGVVAIGSPYGLEATVTSGIVSALHRQMTSPNRFTINDSIQTDAAINHGNSGGPLLNSSGRVVGVNAQIRSDSGGSDGVGFAIPSNTVKSIAAQILETGGAEHAYLGVSLDPIPETVAEELDSVGGVAVTEVRPGTPAARAGLRAANSSRVVDGEEYPTGGDVITEVDGKKVRTAEDLQNAIDAKRPGDTVTLTYHRDGKSREADVKLANRPAELPD